MITKLSLTRLISSVVLLAVSSFTLKQHMNLLQAFFPRPGIFFPLLIPLEALLTALGSCSFNVSVAFF